MIPLHRPLDLKDLKDLKDLNARGEKSQYRTIELPVWGLNEMLPRAHACC